MDQLWSDTVTVVAPQTCPDVLILSGGLIFVDFLFFAFDFFITSVLLDDVMFYLCGRPERRVSTLVAFKKKLV